MSATNARKEFIEHIGNREVLCAKIATGEYNDYDDQEFKTFLLKKDYTELDYLNFLSQINYIYDSSYGGQELFGTIWYKDGTWSIRGEYDGSEWWEHVSKPEIPKELE